jgi:hypothetical protein
MILDRAVEKVATVNLRGAGINPSNLPYISCSLEPTSPQQQGDKVASFYRLFCYKGRSKKQNTFSFYQLLGVLNDILAADL